MPIERPNRNIHSSSFEDRLSSVEGDYSDVRAQLAEHNVKLDYIKQSISEGFTEINNSIVPLTTKLTSLTDEVEDHKEFIVEYKDKKKARKAFWLKVIAPILSTAGGAVGMWLWKVVLTHGK